MIKKKIELRNETVGQSAYYQTCQKFLKDACITNFIYFLMRYFQNTNADLKKVLIPGVINLFEKWK